MATPHESRIGIAKIESKEHVEKSRHYSLEEINRLCQRVSVTADSIESQRMGFGSPIRLRNNSNGNYLIIKDNNFHYLFPKPGLRINQYNSSILEDIFVCNIRDPNNQIIEMSHLIRPAIVELTDSYKGKEWSLIKKGQLCWQ